jgi:lipopolysaccharide export LptBFGC system permease protein LptF
MKKIIALMLAAILAVSTFGLLTACGRGASDIERITVSENESNGVGIKIYNVELKDSIIWADLSDQDREKLAVAAFDEAQKKIAEDDVFNYQITGTADEPAIFMYDHENRKMIIYVAREKVGEVDVTPPEIKLPEN